MICPIYSTRREGCDVGRHGVAAGLTPAGKRVASPGWRPGLAPARKVSPRLRRGLGDDE